MPDRLLIVLDLDETLFHSWTQEIEEQKADFRIGEEYHTYIRPGAVEFVRTLLNDPRFEVAIFTTATQEYAELALKGMGFEASEFVELFARDRCTRTSDVGWGDSGEGYWVKDLRKLMKRNAGWSLERTIAIDDIARNYERQYSNLLRVEPFQADGEPQPEIFPALRAMLERLVTMADVRPLEKRGWYASERRRTSMREAEEEGPAL